MLRLNDSRRRLVAYKDDVGGSEAHNHLDSTSIIVTRSRLRLLKRKGASQRLFVGWGGGKSMRYYGVEHIELQRAFRIQGNGSTLAPKRFSTSSVIYFRTMSVNRWKTLILT